MIDDADLPIGWARATLPELIAGDGFVADGDWVESKDQDPNGEVRLTQLADVGDGEFRDRSHRFLTSERASKLRCTFLSEGDLMIARMPDPLGRSCVFPGSHQKCVTAVDVCIVRPGSDGINNRWLMHFVNSPAFRAAVASLQSGSTRKRISKKNLCTLQVPVPTRDEQDRIAADLDSYLSRLQEAVAGLERVRRNLTRYRASVLQAAVEGRLVPTEAELARAEGRDYEPASELLKRILAERRRRWEEAELEKLKAKGRAPTGERWKERYPPPIGVASEAAADLPEGWCWTSLDAIADVQGGLAKGKKRKPGQRVRSVPYLRVANVQRGFLDLAHMKEIEATEDEIEQLRLLPDDMLFNEGGDRDKLGRGWVWSGEISECIHQNHVFRARPVAGSVRPEFVSWYANTVGQRYFFDEGRQTVNLASINKTKLRGLPIPLPPLAEQDRIATEVERLTSVDDAAVEQVANARLRCERLRQGVLAWAFEGKLVDRNPDDEPAAVLLERIRKSREADGGGGRARRRCRGRGRR